MERIVTIERHIMDQEREHPEATGMFSNLLYDVALAAKIIARETTRAGLGQILGLAGRVNVQGRARDLLQAGQPLEAVRDQVLGPEGWMTTFTRGHFSKLNLLRSLAGSGPLSPRQARRRRNTAGTA